MSVGTLCRNEWIALIVIHIVFLYKMVSSPLYISKKRVCEYYFRYHNYADKVSPLQRLIAPPRWVFGVVWGVMYLLLIPAVYVFFHYDDVCHADGGHYDVTYQAMAWIFIIINGVLNLSWDRVLSLSWSIPIRSGLAAFLTFATCATAIVVTIVLFLVALDHDDNETVLFSAIVYLFYSVWTAYATVVGIAFSMYTNSPKRRR